MVEPRSNPVRDAARIALELAETKAQKALDNLERARQRMLDSQNFPDEPPPGAVIKFDIQFRDRSSTTVYQYVALRPTATPDRWYVTNSSTSRTWEELCNLMMRDVTAHATGMPAFYEFDKGKWRGRKP